MRTRARRRSADVRSDASPVGQRPRAPIMGEPLERRLLLASVSGRVFNDYDADGVIDALTESGLANWVVFHDIDNDGIRDSATSTFTSTDVPKSIPDPGDVTSNIVAAGQVGTVTDVNVTVNVQHTFIGDITLTLISPSGAQVVLVSNPGGTNNFRDNFTNTTFDDEAATEINSGTAPYTGSFRPESPALLSALDGTVANGTWQLRVHDFQSPDEGTLTGWSLTIGTGETSAATDAQGNYTLTNLPAGNLTIREVVQAPFTPTVPAGGVHNVTVAANDTVTGRNFGNRRPPAEVRGTKWNDYNNNGARDAGEPGLSGVTVYVDLTGNNAFDAGSEPSAVTGADGSYAISSVPPGTWQVREQIPAGYLQTFPTAASAGEHTVTVVSNQILTGINFGNREIPGEVRGTKWNDLNNNGAQDAGELGLSGVTVYVDMNANNAFDAASEPSAVTTATGTYAITNVRPGSWQVREVVPAGYMQTFPSLAGAGGEHNVTVVSGQIVNGINFGNRQIPGEVRGTKWNDVNGDGDQDAGELGLAGVTVYVDYNANDTFDSATEPSAVTTATGSYAITDVRPGTWQVREVVPAGFVQTFPAAGPTGGEHTVTVASGQVVNNINFGNRVPTAIQDRHVFYNNSAFDGNNPAANAQDDAAVAPDKDPLLPGQQASFRNYTSYNKGLNGVMIDVTGLAAPANVGPEDFVVHVGNNNNPATWAVGPTPSVATRPISATTTRVTLIWADGAITKKWARIRMLSNADTGLAAADTFYFGNAVGESGNAHNTGTGVTSDAVVNGTDFAGARDNQRGSQNLAPIDWRWDYNRDRLVNGTDLAIARDNTTSAAAALQLFTAPAAVSAASTSTGGTGAATKRVGRVSLVQQVVAATTVGGRASIRQGIRGR